MNAPGYNSLFILGMNHRVAEVELRGRYALSAPERDEARESLGERGLAGNILLSTCNRTELYGAHPGEPGEERADFQSLLFPGHGAAFEPYWHTGWNTAFHLFRVSSGLDSMIVGESEILRQVKLAFEESMDKGVSGRVLSDLFRQALEVGKRVRTETQISLGSVSIASTAVKLARKIFGSLDERKVVIVGAGETGLQVAQHLKSEGVVELKLLNRTLEKARKAAEEVGAEAGSLDELGAAVRAADLVVGAVEAPEPLIHRKMMDGAPGNTRVFIDISVPRSMDPDLAKIPGMFHFDIDDLTHLINDAKSERDDEARKTKVIVVGEVHKFLAKQHFTGLAPLVEDMRQAFDETLGSAVEQLGHDEFSAEAEKLAKRLLGVSLNTLKMSSRTHVSLEQVQGAYEIFLKEHGG